jgi:hypothetical protein
VIALAFGRQPSGNGIVSAFLDFRFPASIFTSLGEGEGEGEVVLRPFNDRSTTVRLRRATADGHEEFSGVDRAYRIARRMPRADECRGR